jgi:hypothetical protein
MRMSNMIKTALRITTLAAALMVPVTFAMRGENEPAADRRGHLSGMVTRITMADGTSRSARLEGVGCSVSICSRTVITGKTGNEALVKTWLDSIATIRVTTASDAQFLLKDGTARRLSLVKDFRVLYLANRLGGTETLDLAQVKSVEFSPDTK